MQQAGQAPPDLHEDLAIGVDEAEAQQLAVVVAGGAHLAVQPHQQRLLPRIRHLPAHASTRLNHSFQGQMDYMRCHTCSPRQRESSAAC